MATLPGTTYRDLRASLQSELKDRVLAHQARIAGVKRMPMKAGQHLPLNLIAQGDSWFDYPLPVPVINQSDIVAHLKRLPAMVPEVLSVAQYGESAEDMLGVKKIHDLFDQFNDPANGKFDAILFSGGGNDLVGNQFRLWLNDALAANDDPANGLNDSRIAAIFGVVRAGYEDLMLARDKVDPTIPIFAHSYDFAIPSGIGIVCVGPWLRLGLDDRGWTNQIFARTIVKDLLLQFNSMLDDFAADPANNFVHVQTQGTLSDTQWANELHPTPIGFAAITAKFVDALRSRFPGRI
ncbi:SGNH/GDSL hydrolase family protein [Glaciimonas soli]|uniref:SGNH/GDSL hydrolase family protein n=1 Tax=Glaciimonas soli TaxID=2590999 RepID=A0A843YN47_9BURK|nr:SGNH/GDSL hydrolase family protein [Glaciimonas soli]MQQ99193.1 SGNH/GDSL hydrolase family protein [Glaciimonas soli]